MQFCHCWETRFVRGLEGRGGMGEVVAMVVKAQLHRKEPKDNVDVGPAHEPSQNFMLSSATPSFARR